ncbi:hypothetical protein [Georgenia sp. MJ170]|uniref:hypothetical protein n=1 Tax=Georgenia sunbinii TaxID=3117728 RepID=UPI002F260C4F
MTVVDTLALPSLEPLVGRRAVVTTPGGQRVAGTLERHPYAGAYLIVRADDGRWARTDRTVTLAEPA